MVAASEVWEAGILQRNIQASRYHLLACLQSSTLSEDALEQKCNPFTIGSIDLALIERHMFTTQCIGKGEVCQPQEACLAIKSSSSPIRD